MTNAFLKQFEIPPDLLLRELEVDDAFSLWLLTDKNREDFKLWLPWVDTTQSPDDSRRFIHGIRLYAYQKREYHWGIFKNSLLIGLIGIHNLDWENSRCTFGYWLDSDEQGEGIMTKVVTSLVPLVHEKLHISTIEIHCSIENHSSYRVAQKANFTHLKTLPQAAIISGVLQDIMIFQHLD